MAAVRAVAVIGKGFIFWHKIWNICSFLRKVLAICKNKSPDLLRRSDRIMRLPGTVAEAAVLEGAPVVFADMLADACWGGRTL
jgi:hypothetical protein